MLQIDKKYLQKTYLIKKNLSKTYKGFFSNLFYWSIVDLQCCFNFYCTAKWFIIHIYKYSLFHILFHYGLSKSIEYSSLCSTVWPCCLSSLCIKYFASANPKLPVHPSLNPCPLWQPQSVLYVWESVSVS